jgi:hypothetical protein
VSSVSQLPLQQSHDELHDAFCSLHTSPSGLQPMGLRHMPTVAGDVMTHVTGMPEPPGRPAEPQQSLSVVQRSPTTWQPLAGWQISTPLGPHGAHARLQQGPPHAGKLPAEGGGPLPLVPVPPQSCPSTRPQFAGPAGAEAAHVPTLLPAATVHAPVQQSDPDAHASPGCEQNDEGWHEPALQRPEQQSEFALQALPSVRQLELSAAQVPPLQVWLQHEPLPVHGWPSAMHAG